MGSKLRVGFLGLIGFIVDDGLVEDKDFGVELEDNVEEFVGFGDVFVVEFKEVDGFVDEDKLVPFLELFPAS